MSTAPSRDSAVPGEARLPLSQPSGVGDPAREHGRPTGGLPIAPGLETKEPPPDGTPDELRIAANLVRPPADAPAATSPPTRGKAENLWLNLGFNAVAPALVLSFLSDSHRLGPTLALVLALAFPLGYGIWDLRQRRTWNLFSVIGVVGTLFTGGLGLLKMSGFWFAVKEAAVPVVLGAAMPLSLRTSQPLVRTLLYNDQVLNTARIQQALVERNNLRHFDALMAWASWVLGLTLLASAVVNFGLAWWLLPDQSGTDEFNRQLAKLQFWSWPGTFIPTSVGMFLALFRLLKGLEELTGLPGKELFQPPKGTT